jgi:hypothetical protein
MTLARSTLICLILCAACITRISAFTLSSSRRASHRDSLLSLQLQLHHHTPLHTASTRRIFVSTLAASISTLASSPALAIDTATSSIDDLHKIARLLQRLLDNWQTAVIDCTFADVPRDLLEAKNKDLLLEKASVFALFDKSVSVETCKTSNKTVRQYLAAVQVNLQKKLVSAATETTATVDSDALLDKAEAIQQALARANSLSYTAGVADFNAVNNFEKSEKSSVLATDSNLEQARLAIQEAVNDLNAFLTLVSG